MSEYQVQRSNMVDSQLRTNQVTDHRILRAMLDIPREKFVPAEKQGLAYMDCDILVDRDKDGDDRYMMSPMTIAKLAQLAGVDNKDMVLVIGCASGYLAAVLANLADSVICLESDERMGDGAAARLEELGCDNAATVIGSLEDGYSKEGPYDVIIFNGSVEVIPEDLFDQLKDKGRLVAVQLTDGGIGRAHLYRKIGDTIGENRVSFDASAHPLPGFKRDQSFIF
jgi:protein-L-isoaspartate(D-aspartate) O-methyltransferase